MRAQYPFTWRDAERRAVARRLDREFGLRDAAFTVLSEQTGYSSPLGIFFEIEPRLRPEEVCHADAIATAAFMRSQPNRLIAATDTGIVEMRRLLEEHARWAAALTAHRHRDASAQS
jgi:FMN phosphatase YigB (HAD superfamily)